MSWPAIYALWSMADLLSTAAGFEFYAGYEANPFAATLIRIGGLWALAIVKGIHVLMLVAFKYIAQSSYAYGFPRWVYPGMSVSLALLFAFIAIHNIWVMAGAG